MVDLSNQQWIGALFFTAGVGLLVPLGIAVATELPVLGLPSIYAITIAYLYRRGNSLSDSLVFMAVPTLFVAGIYLVVFARSDVLPSMAGIGGLILAGIAAIGVGYLYYGAITNEE